MDHLAGGTSFYGAIMDDMFCTENKNKKVKKYIYIDVFCVIVRLCHIFACFLLV